MARRWFFIWEGQSKAELEVDFVTMSYVVGENGTIKISGDLMEEVLYNPVKLAIALRSKAIQELACMLLFNGDAEGSGFKGKILPGGVDTQRQLKNDPLQLSARYILEGVDSAGKYCRLL